MGKWVETVDSCIMVPMEEQSLSCCAMGICGQATEKCMAQIEMRIDRGLELTWRAWMPATLHIQDK
jgi:hypothetical protein